MDSFFVCVGSLLRLRSCFPGATSCLLTGCTGTAHKAPWNSGLPAHPPDLILQWFKCRERLRTWSVDTYQVTAGCLPEAPLLAVLNSLGASAINVVFTPRYQQRHHYTMQSLPTLLTVPAPGELLGVAGLVEPNRSKDSTR